MYAALYGDRGAVRLLLNAGANPNDRNDASVTALMWSVDSVETTRLLLERGADVNARSADGQTPVALAAARFGASDVLKLLIDHGASLENQPALNRAASVGDAAQMRLLIDRGARPAALRVDFASRSGCQDCFDMLLQLSGPEDLNRALQSAAQFGDSTTMRVLLNRGAKPTGDVLRAAAASERIPVDGVTQLLERGVRDDAALGVAMRHGETEVVQALRKTGATAVTLPAPVLKKPEKTRDVRTAIETSLPLLQHADVVFLKTAGCVSCHHNSAFLMTAAAARRKALRVDESMVQSQLKATSVYLESWRERILQDIPIPGGVDTASYILAGLATAQYPPDPATDALARYLRRRQASDGGWRIGTHRPPVEASDIEVTALSLRSLQVYAPKPQAAEYEQAITHGRAWLTRATPRSTEDHAFQLLGLAWTRADNTVINDSARKLIALQRSDGGWGQIPTLGSDAYATGQALTALAESGSLRTSDAVYRRGVQFLLSTQLDDGSWYVRTRAIPIQPYFDSQFPHGRDQFISAAATNWATMALLSALH
jgi:ankyrin repeat protein